MTLAELKLIKIFVRATEAQALKTMYRVSSQNLSKKTGLLFDSIKAQMFVDCRADKVVFTLFIQAGEGDAFYGIFQEFGTGIYMEEPSLAKQPYFDGNKKITFNDERLKFPKGQGFLILKRTSGEKVKIHSEGIPATHWFSKGAKQTFDIFFKDAAALQGKIAALPNIKSQIYF